MSTRYTVVAAICFTMLGLRAGAQGTGSPSKAKVTNTPPAPWLAAAMFADLRCSVGVFADQAGTTPPPLTGSTVEVTGKLWVVVTVINANPVAANGFAVSLKAAGGTLDKSVFSPVSVTSRGTTKLATQWNHPGAQKSSDMGTETLTATVDSVGIIKETDKSNNTCSTSFKWLFDW